MTRLRSVELQAQYQNLYKLAEATSQVQFHGNVNERDPVKQFEVKQQFAQRKAMLKAQVTSCSDQVEKLYARDDQIQQECQDKQLAIQEAQKYFELVPVSDMEEELRHYNEQRIELEAQLEDTESESVAAQVMQVKQDLIKENSQLQDKLNQKAEVISQQSYTNEQVQAKVQALRDELAVTELMTGCKLLLVDGPNVRIQIQGTVHDLFVNQNGTVNESGLSLHDFIAVHQAQT